MSSVSGCGWRPGLTVSPVAVKLALDYTLLEPPAELLQLKRLIEKATPQVTAGPEPLQIEGEAIEESEQDHQVCLPQRCDFILAYCTPC